MRISDMKPFASLDINAPIAALFARTFRIVRNISAFVFWELNDVGDVTGI
jgi:hypothetical protein